MYFFSIAIAFSLLNLSLGSPLSLLCKYELEELYAQVKPLLTPDSVDYIDSILKDASSLASYDHQSHLSNIYENFTNVEELEKLSKFFFKSLEYFHISMLEMAESYKGFRLIPRNPQDCDKVVRMDKHFEWAITALPVANFALLRQRLGPSNMTEFLIFEVITFPQMQQIGFVIEFIKEILDKKLNEGLDLSDKEREAFKLFLLFLKDFCHLSHNCIVAVLNPPRKDFIRSPLILNPYVIDGVIKSYQLDD